MSRRPPIAATLLALPLLFAAAAIAAPPRLLDVDADVGDYGSAITLSFDQPMLTWPGRGELPSLRLVPAHPCNWYWEDDTTLACADGDAVLQPATRYTLHVDGGLASQQGEDLVATAIDFVPALPALTVNVQRWRDGYPLLVVATQAGSSAEAIHAVLDVAFDGRPLAYTLQPTRDDATGADRAYRLRVSHWPAGPGRLTVAARAGLASPLGEERGSEQASLFVADVAPEFAVAGVGCAGYGSDPGGGCRQSDPVLLFTKPPSPETLAWLRANLPAGLAVAERNDCGNACYRRDGLVPVHGVRLHSERSGHTFLLSLPATLTATDGSTLAPVKGIDVRLAPHDPATRVEPTITLGLPGATTPAAVSQINIDEASTWAELSVGAHSRSRMNRVDRNTETERWQPVRTPALPAPLLRTGGVSLGVDAGSPSTPRLTAVAPFQVIAGVYGREAVVWVSDWQSGRGLAAIAIEVLTVDWKGREATVGRTSTDADGLAVLALPAGLSVEGGTMVFVRASRDRQRSVLPLGPLGFRAEVGWRDDSGSAWRADHDQPLQYGASDRLLYRPGDTVRYRVWARGRDRNHLVPWSPADGPAAVRLTALDDASEAAAWTATLDEWGSVHGELALPATLADGDYCIRIVTEREDWDAERGACFRVSRFDAQSAWAGLQVRTPLLRAGDEVVLEIEGGYYSGGPAARASATLEVQAIGERFEDVYPQFADYEFVASPTPFDPSNAYEIGDVDTEGTLDAAGRLTRRWTLPRLLAGDAEGTPKPELPFARLFFTAAVAVAGESPVYSPERSARYAAYPRYVGLRGDHWWFARDADPVFTAVVASDAGVELPPQPVMVRIETIVDAGDADEDGDGAAAVATVLARCELRSGTPAACPFRAPEDGRYAVVAEAEGAAPVRLVRWFGGRSPPPEENAEPATLTVLGAVDGSAPVRLRLRQPHARATAWFVVEYEGLRRQFVRAVGPETEIALDVDPAWAPGVAVRVFLRPELADAAAGLAEPTLTAVANVAIARPATPTVVATLAETGLAPGDTAILHLRNPSPGRRLVVVAVVDDSLHQQAAHLHKLLDPDTRLFRGATGRWGDGDWFDLVARGHGARLTPPPGLRASNRDDSTAIESIEVTGSRLDRDQLVPIASTDDIVAADARLRAHFAATAFWEPGVVLAPGEARDLAIVLPDNLTRWRVLVWSGDAGDDFALSQPTLTTSLPLELRVRAPTRLFVGDRGEATVDVRAASGQADVVDVQAGAEGAGVRDQVAAQPRLAAFGSAAQALALSPTDTGSIAITANAHSPLGADATTMAVPVRTRLGERTFVQAGWLAGDGVSLPLPALPAGASSPRLHVELAQGGEAWRREWLRSLHDYPHRCWEQTLSRAVGAALALRHDDADERWPDAQATIGDAYAASARFRVDNGRYTWFESAPGGGDHFAGDAPWLLSAYTLRAFGQLAALGQPAPAPLVEELQQLLPRRLAGAGANRDPEFSDEGRATAVAALAAADVAVATPVFDGLWARWEALSWTARSELVRALAATGDDRASDGLARLRDAGTVQGLRRVIRDPRSFAGTMGSPLRDQCAVTATLWDLDTVAATRGVREEFLRGLNDLYAGGAADGDTQADVHCLLALAAAAQHDGDNDGTTRVAARVGTAAATLAVDAATPLAAWDTAEPHGTLTLDNDDDAGTGTLANYTATFAWDQDLRDATAEAVGLHLSRRYAVLRDGQWQPMPAAGVRVGDWVRVTLRVQSPALRHFVAVSDEVPGGWVTRDIALANIAGSGMARAADPGSRAFAARRTGVDRIDLYAVQLPKGTHDVHYFVQAVHAGRYFAPPASAQTMYGRATRATTTADDVRIAPAR